MSKRTSDFRPTDPGLTRGEPGPPPLSKELIAKLQKAVSAARRNRIAQPKQEANGEAPPQSER
jgi:hypothetical protein